MSLPVNPEVEALLRRAKNLTTRKRSDVLLGILGGALDLDTGTFTGNIPRTLIDLIDARMYEIEHPQEVET